ncbi:hypothetical protein GcC1_015045 [Golovinomyces cichoracearum]|uniref:Peptidase A2 domain-containing protein n=1 Tax=Golovinomyces cichoracearum TaxID=62708 RepID=A0A420J6C2_9PEZI|nr:hypothetical protein GcC1_015045 [Golovinomyces cichoracearum]
MLHSPANVNTWVCLDSGCTMSLIDRKFLSKQHPTTKLSIMSTPMIVRGIGYHTYDASQLLEVDIFLPNGKGSAGHIKKELHVVECLPAKVLLGVDIMLPEGWYVDFESQILTFPYCSGIQVPILVKSAFPEGPVPIFSKQRAVIPPHSNALISISSNHGIPLNLPPCDLIYKPYENNSLTAYTQLMGPNIDKALVQNNSSHAYPLAENTLLGEIINFRADQMSSISGDIFYSSAISPNTHETRLRCKGALAFHASTSLTSFKTNVSIKHETIAPNGVTIYGDNEQKNKLNNILKKFKPLWDDQNTSFAINPSGEYMKIPLIDGWENKYKPGKARVYPVRKADREVIDKTFDELHQQGHLNWTSGHTPFSFPCFVIWKNTPSAKRIE